MILLDTAALLRLIEGEPFGAAARDAIDAAVRVNALLVSAVSAWELGLLATRTGRTSAKIGDARIWWHEALNATTARVLTVTPEILLDAIYLPEPFHRDPGDRWIVATARIEAVTLITPDRAILAYAAAGHVKAIRA